MEEPIPVSVAGGKDIMASGEWSALILLADDSIENNVLVCLNTKNDLYFSHIYVKVGLFGGGWRERGNTSAPYTV